MSSKYVFIFSKTIKRGWSFFAVPIKIAHLKSGKKIISLRANTLLGPKGLKVFQKNKQAIEYDQITKLCETHNGMCAKYKTTGQWKMVMSCQNPV